MLLLQGNLERILTSIRIAKERGATLRVGPELEITYATHDQENSNNVVTFCCSLAEVMGVRTISWKVAPVQLHYRASR